MITIRFSDVTYSGASPDIHVSVLALVLRVLWFLPRDRVLEDFPCAFSFLVCGSRQNGSPESARLTGFGSDSNRLGVGPWFWIGTGSVLDRFGQGVGPESWIEAGSVGDRFGAGVGPGLD